MDQNTLLLLQIARESQPFTQFRAIHNEALRQLAAIASGLNPKPTQDTTPAPRAIPSPQPGPVARGGA